MVRSDDKNIEPNMCPLRIDVRGTKHIYNIVILIFKTLLIRNGAFRNLLNKKLQLNNKGHKGEVANSTLTIDLTHSKCIGIEYYDKIVF